MIEDAVLTVNSAEVVPSMTLVAPLKVDPVIVTCWPTCPEPGEKPVIDGGGWVTVNELELVATPEGVVREIGPVMAPLGTCAVMSVDELTTKLGSAVPLNFTLVAPVKFVPWMSTPVPTGPLVGVSESIVGGGSAHEPVNQDELQASPPAVDTEMGPEFAKIGTTAWSSEAESTVTELAKTWLNPTSVAPATKFEPKMSMLAPADPQVGVNELIVGGTPNDDALVAVPLAVGTEIGPVSAPGGTLAWISVSESTVKIAAAPLKLTLVAPVKFTPRMSTLVPVGPDPGVNELMTGVVTTELSISRSSKLAETEHPAA